jgi:hypothetical protein
MPEVSSAQAAPRPWPRFLRLSLTDFLFLTLLFWLFMADPMGWDRLLWDGDVALHTRIGDYILDHGHVPTADPFSFSKPGERFYAFQWLTGVIFASLNRWVGLKGIVLLCGVVIALYLTMLARDMVKRGTNGLLAILLVMVGANASAIHFHARPHLFTLLFLVIANALVAEDRARPSWKIWLLVPLMILWVNMHSGFPALLAVIGVLVFGSALSREWPNARRYATVLAACALATLVNPNGIALHRHISKFLNSPWAMANINEYQSPVFRDEAMYLYMGILFLALMVCGKHFARRQWTECLWILMFAAGSLQSARHVPLFIVTVMPLIGLAATELWAECTAGQSKASVLGVLADLSEKATAKIQPVSIWLFVMIAGVALFTSPRRWPSDLSEKYFPRSVVHQYKDQLAAARVFTTDQWGDYLLWTGYPRQLVFMDGRSDFFGEEIGREYTTVLSASPGWRQILERRRVNMILVPPETPVVGMLTSGSAWHVLYQDKQAVLLKQEAR